MAYRKLTHSIMDRMLKIHAALKRGAPVTCTSIAKMCEISPGTALADITYMTERLRLPIAYDPPNHSYRYTEKVGALPLVNMTEGEVFALMIARKALEPYRGTSLFGPLSASFAKLTASLRDEISFAPTDQTAEVSFRTMGVGKADSEIFNTLVHGVRRRLELTFDYRKPGERRSAARRVRPYHLSLRDNLWYLVAYDLARQAERTFALPRMTRAECTKTTFVRPADFSAEKYFSNALGVMGGDGEHEVVVRFRGAAADRVREREWHESEVTRELPDGRYEISFKLGSLFEVERWILSWGVEAEAVRPAALRRAIATTVSGLAQIYDCTPRPRRSARGAA